MSEFTIPKKQFSDETRLRMSEAAKRRAATPKFLEQVRGYWKPFCTEDELRRDYDQECMSQVEIAAKYGVTLKRVQTSMRRYGIEARPQVKRNQRGEANHMWKGDNAKYAALHYRLQHLPDQPTNCTQCGCDLNAVRAEWANLTGRYEDITDYAKMCVSCHRRYDAARWRETGQRTSPVRGKGVMPNA